MKMSRIATSLMTIVALMSVTETAKADEYAFNRLVGKVYVDNVNVTFAENGLTLSTRIHAPQCPSRYHAQGYIKVTYYASNGGSVSKKWPFSGKYIMTRNTEEFSDFLPNIPPGSGNRLPPGGTVRVDASAVCIYDGDPVVPY